MQQPNPAVVTRIVLTVVCLVIVIVSWGTNYPLMKLAIADMPPLSFAALRIFGGAVVIGLILLLSKRRPLLPSREERIALGWISVLQFASVLGLAGISLLTLPASRTITVIYTMPLWAVGFDMLIARNRLNFFQLFGIGVSLVGMLLFFDPTVIDWTEAGALAGLMYALVAAVAWALGAVLYRKRSWSAPLLSQVFWQLVVACCVLAIAAIIFERGISRSFSTNVVMILLWNWVVPTAIAVWSWNKVLSYISASIAGQFLMLTPFVGIAVSAWMFGDELPVIFWVSASLIVLGGGLVLLQPRSRSRQSH